MTTTADVSGIDTLLRMIRNSDDSMPPSVARYLLRLDFSAADKKRMISLAQRHQNIFHEQWNWKSVVERNMGDPEPD